MKDAELLKEKITFSQLKKAGIGGSFTYATLGEPINLDNMLQGTMPSFSELANYVFYTATGLSLDESAISSNHYYIGESKAHRVYLIYQAKADFLRTEEAALDKDKLNTIIKHHHQHSENKGCLIFAAAKFMGQNSLLKQGVEFCQLPYAIHRLEGEH